MKCHFRFLITTFLFFTRKAWTLYKSFIICLISYGKFGTPQYYSYVIHSTTSISGNFFNVSWYVPALFARFFTSVTLRLKLEYIRGYGNNLWNQKTSGPVNAHLTPGPGIYFNAFIHVYSPRAGTDNPLGTNVDVNRKPRSLCPFVASFKIISLKYDFKHISNDFIHVYRPSARGENPLGTNLWSQQKALITSIICCKFQTNLFEFWFYTHFLMFFHMYIAPG